MTVDKEYLEMYELEKEMNQELLEEYKKVERVIAHQISPEKYDGLGETSEYLIKWNCLPYSECTWEDEGLIIRKYQDKIDEYLKRIEATTIPGKNHPVKNFLYFVKYFIFFKYLLFTYKRDIFKAFKRKPKFQKLEEMPDFLRPKYNPDMELRDYQLEGLNWLLHAWSKYVHF